MLCTLPLEGSDVSASSTVGTLSGFSSTRHKSLTSWSHYESNSGSSF